MFTCEVDTSDLERHWTQALGELSKGLGVAVKAAVEEGAEEARTKHQYKDQTGALTKSIKGVMQGAGSESAQGYIAATDNKASWIENGTAPHVILPKSGLHGPLPKGQSHRGEGDIGTTRVALRWKGPDGRTHFAKIVRHPGGKPYPFMGPAYLKAQRVLVREIEVAIDKARRIMEQD